VGLNYVVDPNTGMNAFQYSVNGQVAASSPGNTYFDLGPGTGIGSPGDYLGGYLQIQTDTNNPSNSGTAVFGNISIIPLPTLNIVTNGGQSVLYWSGLAKGFTVQTSTNLSSTNWTTVTNATPIQGITITNGSPAAFFRLQY
jgi:hypothetical protein